MNDLIQIRNVTKKYPKADKHALNGVSLDIGTGEAFGILGPNGAGKTTLMSIITTLALPTSGTVTVDGEEVNRQRVEIKKKISFVTQHISLRKDMTVMEVMELSGRLYGLPGKVIKKRTLQLLEYTGIADKKKNTARGLSGGQQRKLMIARALLSDPEILVLDEPTVGLDPQARRKIWDMLISLKMRGLTLLLTTHYIDEAESVCDRVAFISGGKVSDVDTPENMISEIGKYAIDIFEDKKTGSYFFRTADEAEAFARTNDKEGNRVKIRESTLEDVFLKKMGTEL